MAQNRTTQYAEEDKLLSGGRHGIGNLATEIAGDEHRSHGCFRGEEIGSEPKTGAKPPVTDKKPTL